jgi:hypothetical protein
VRPAQVHAAQHQRRAHVALIPDAASPKAHTQLCSQRVFRRACCAVPQSHRPERHLLWVNQSTASARQRRVARLNRCDLSIVIAVTTRDSRSVAYLCSSSADDTIPGAATHLPSAHGMKPRWHQANQQR